MSKTSDTTPDSELPVLHPPRAVDQQTATEIPSADLTAMEAQLTAKTHDLADSLLHNAMLEMEAALFERVSNELRQQLPHLIHEIVSAYVVADESDG